MNDQPLLTIGYSTLAERIQNITPPKLDISHQILISVQNPKKISYSRPNFSHDLIESEDSGVAKSRNIVLDNCAGKYLVFADDEIQFLPESLYHAVNFFESHEELDLLLAQTIDTEGELRKDYPSKETKLTLFNSGIAATYEILVRVSSIKNRKVRFDEKFGAGVKNYLGDEYIFITDLLKSKGKAIFLPITIAIHPVDSSGSSWGDSRNLNARAVIFNRIFGKWAPLIRIAFYVKSWRKTPGFKYFLQFIIGPGKRLNN